MRTEQNWAAWAVRKFDLGAEPPRTALEQLNGKRGPRRFRDERAALGHEAHRYYQDTMNMWRAEGIALELANDWLARKIVSSARWSTRDAAWRALAPHLTGPREWSLLDKVIVQDGPGGKSWRAVWSLSSIRAAAAREAEGVKA